MVPGFEPLLHRSMHHIHINFSKAVCSKSGISFVGFAENEGISIDNDEKTETFLMLGNVIKSFVFLINNIGKCT